MAKAEADEALRALTLIRPWDEPVVDGSKPVENRTWPPPRSILGRTIAIHAGRKYGSLDADFIEEELGYVVLPAHESDRVRAGTVVGVATVLGALDLRRGGRTLIYPDSPDELRVCEALEALEASPWFSGPVGWLLGDVVPLRRHVPCRGAQGLWRVPRPVAYEVRRQIPEVA